MLARLFTFSKVPKTQINEFFTDNLSSALFSGNLTPAVGLSFRSVHTFCKQTTFMIDDSEWKTGIVQDALRPKSEFRYRNIPPCMLYPFR